MIKANGYFYASHYCDDGRLRYPTGIRVTDNSKSSQLLLKKIDNIIVKYVESKRILELPILVAELYDHLDTQLGKGRYNNSTFFYDYATMLQKMKSGDELKNGGGRYSEATIRAAENVMVALKGYEAATGARISYGFSVADFNKYVGWLTASGKSKNTIAWIVGYLTLFLSKMFAAKKHSNLAFQSFSHAAEEGDSVYLNVDEITRLYELPLTGGQERARDIFVYGCWLALRAKDLNRVNEYEKRGNVFEILTSKTGEKVIIPVHWMAERIYKKYDGRLPVYSGAHGINYHLPTICRMAQITERRLVAVTKGGVRQSEYFDKCDLVSVHTARRSFATNMYLQGFPVRAIMKITGHKTESSFFRYIRIDKEESAKMMNEHPFFKEPGAGASNPSAGS